MGHLCEMPHSRLRAAGEAYEVRGIQITAAGGERVTDMHHEYPTHHADSRLCAGHSRWFRELVEQTPDVVMWLRSCILPGAVTASESVRTPAVKRTAPLDLAALDAADRELATMAAWAVYAGAPTPSSVRRRPSGEVIGFRGRNIAPVFSLTRWTLSRLRGFEAQEWAPDMLAHLADVRASHMARWPLVDRTAA